MTNKENKLKYIYPPKTNETTLESVRYPKTHTTLNFPNKVTNNVGHKSFSEDDDMELLKVVVDKNETEVGLTVQNSDKNPITHFDQAVHEVACTFYSAGQHYFTANQVAQKLIGANSVKVTDTLIKNITKSIQKMATTFVAIDHSKQFYQWDKHKEYEVEDVETEISLRYMLNVDIDLKIKMNGNEASAFRINQMPPFLEYSSIYNQLVTLQDALIDTSSYLTHNTETIAIKHYLNKRIQDLKGMRKNNKKMNVSDIKYQSMYEELNKPQLMNNNARKQRERFIKHVENILKAYKDNGYIKDYTLTHHKKDNTLTGKIIIGKIKSDDTYI